MWRFADSSPGVVTLVKVTVTSLSQLSLAVSTAGGGTGALQLTVILAGSGFWLKTGGCTSCATGTVAVAVAEQLPLSVTVTAYPPPGRLLNNPVVLLAPLLSV